MSSSNSLSGYNGQAYSSSVRIDTVTDTIQSFSFTVAGKGTWVGTGGTASYSVPFGTSTLFKLDISPGTTFSQSVGGLTSGSLVTFAYGPAAFGGFIDGYPTTINTASFFTKSAFIGTSNFSSYFFATISSASGTEYVPEPGTAALGLAGLAALRGVRRRKAAR